jgi:hypothetical protein
MGKVHERIDGRLRKFIEDQKIFFVATAPLTGDGHVNLSPKGLSGAFAILDDLTVAFLDFGGSGAETVAHLRENGRITLMWCAFEGPPNIVRVHGTGEAIFRDDPRFADLLTHFPAANAPSLRAVILVRAKRVSDSCGYTVPLFDYREERTLHNDFFARKTDEEFAEYCEKKDYVGSSLDGLPGLPLPLPPRTTS